MNCTRRKLPPSTEASVLTVSVLASPGTPSSSTWPPASSATSSRSSIASCPTITRLSSYMASSRPARGSSEDAVSRWSSIIRARASGSWCRTRRRSRRAARLLAAATALVAALLGAVVAVRTSVVGPLLILDERRRRGRGAGAGVAAAATRRERGRDADRERPAGQRQRERPLELGSHECLLVDG